MKTDRAVTLDVSQLRNITLDDPILMREIMAALLDDASRQIEALRGAIRRADAKECARLAHSGRGACGNVGAASMAALFSALESEARQGDLSHGPEAVQRLAAELEKLRTEANIVCAA